MTSDRKPAPPPDLARRGSAFWRATVADFELSSVELELLTESCRILDECEALRHAVERDGATVAGSSGQLRVNPAIGELRQHRLALGRLLAQLALPDADGGALATPRTAAARTASLARWKGHTARGTAVAGVILPRRLLGSAAHRERDRWLRDHGVDVADFAAVRRILSASEIAHGLPDSSALARARRRAEGVPDDAA